MAKKGAMQSAPGGKSRRVKDDDVELHARRRAEFSPARWLAMVVGAGLTLSVAWWLRRQGSLKAAAATSDEAPLPPQAMLGGMQRIQEQQPVSLADVALQLRFFCGEELDASAAPLGPPTRRPPSTENCVTFVKMLPRIENVVSLQAPSIGPQLSETAAHHLDRRLTALARLEVDFDALQKLVLHLADWMQGESLGWPRSLTTLLGVHLIHGDEQPRWEQEFIRVRSELAAELSQAHAADSSRFALAAAIACQARLSDYAWREPPQDAEFVDRVAASLEVARSPSDQARALIAAIGAYRSPLPLLERWSSLGEWRKAYQAQKDNVEKTWPFWQFWRLAVEEPLLQRGHRERLAAATAERANGDGEVEAKTEGSASVAVRAMYERNPYPSWSWMRPPVDWPPVLFDWLRSKHWQVPADWPRDREDRPKVLVAGCGTGHWMTHFARHYKDHANIWALDLSLSSLAFTARRVEENSLGNVHLEQADILKLPHVIKREYPFDFVEVGGVLHHLKDPEAGWDRLAELVRPGGVMLVALYSKIARGQGVDPCRDFARKGGYNASSAWSLRRYRADVMKQREDGQAWAVQITTSRDFASLSGVRDLCLHVQETQYTMLEIEEMLGRLGLRWLQMAETVSEDKQKLFKSHIGMDAFSREATPKLWHRFEERYPTTFLGMYEFFVQNCRENACS